MGFDLVSDPVGNSYVIGGCGKVAFLCKYSPEGKLVWKSNIHLEIGRAQHFKIAIDREQNVYITFSCDGALDFGSQKVACQEWDVILAKYDRGGNLLWAKHDGGWKVQMSRDICIDSKGNFYIIGKINDESTFGNITVRPTAGSNSFVAKYDTDGNVIWVNTVGGWNNEGYSLTVNSDEEVFIAGEFTDTIRFDTICFKTAVKYDDNIFLAKLDRNGKFLWAKQLGGDRQEIPSNLALNKTGEIFLNGFFYSPVADFGGCSITNNVNEDNYFIAKFSPEGDCKWVYQGNRGYAGALTANDEGGCYSAYSGSLVSKLDSAGNLVWKVYVKSTLTGGISVLGDKLYLTGLFIAPTSFGDIHFDTSGTNEFYIAKITDTTAAEPVSVIPASSSHTTAFNVYPNPASAVFNFTYSSEVNCVVECRVRNLLGQPVIGTRYLHTGKESAGQIDLGGWPKGIYFAEITAGKERVVRKLLLK
jgi:hypothetical protein